VSLEDLLPLLKRLVTKMWESHCAAKWSQTTAQWMESRLSAILCLSILQPTFCTALSSDILEPLSAVLYSVWRSANFPLCPVWRYTTPGYSMCYALSVDSTADYPIYRLSALICMAILQMTICRALLCLAILETDYLRCSTMPGVTTTDYPLCSTCRYYNRLSALPISAMLEFCPFSLAFGSLSSSYMAWVSNQLEL
jgi:hypothetical protein